jgi:hypothetical protein
VINLNGENNHHLLPKTKKNDWEYTYTSTTRTGLRNLWLMDFLYYFMSKIINEKEISLGSCAKEAYAKGLGPHHPWIIR